MNAAAASNPANPARKTWRQRAVNPYSIGLLVLLLVGGGYGAWQKFGNRKSARDLYNISTVHRADIQDLVTATGTVQPRDYVDVGAQVSGQLKRLHVEVGSVVKQGDLLAEIDPTVLTATAEARRAGLRNQQATLTERESSLVLAQLQATRQKNLMAADATTTEQVQQAEAALRSARAQIAQMKAQIEQTQSQLRADEANLNYARIFAPMSGTVVSVAARQGQTLNANQSAPIILRVADLSTMTVQTQVGEADVSKLRQGMQVYFTTLGSQGRRWYGSLRKVEPTPTVTNNVVLYNALFDVPNNNQSLMTNMTAQVFFIAASAQNALLVPVAAVQRAPMGAGAPGRRDAAAGGAPVASAPRTPPAAANAAPQAAPPTAASQPARSDDERRAMRERLAGMSPDERRTYLESLSPEQRQAMRERRRAEGGEGGADRPVADAGSSPRAPADASNARGGQPDDRSGSGKTGTDRPPRAAASTDTAASAAAGAASRAPVSAGFASAPQQRGARRGTVKVLTADGQIEERQVELGITNRVQVQVLSGLQEGEQVIAGVKVAQQGPGSRGNANANAGGPPGGMGGIPGAGAGGARGR